MNSALYDAPSEDEVNDLVVDFEREMAARKPVAKVMAQEVEKIELDPDGPEATRIEDVAGVPFKLSDGRTWHLAKPSLRFRPVFLKSRLAGTDDDSPGRGMVELFPFVGYANGPAKVAVEDLLKLYLSDAARVPIEPILQAAFELLRLCHRVTVEQACHLLTVTPDQAEDLAVTILRMLRGVEEPQPEETATPNLKETV